MPLQSQLFRGDFQLEAAATSDPAHIQPGARGEYVRKIQQALILLDGANIQADGQYGPATAAAVLAYKRKRNIINRSYQTQPDNIVGKMTMAALDQELLAKENNQPVDLGGLKSHLFRKDPRLEKTLISDPDHVTIGDSGDFVSKIQYAVLLLQGGRIGPAEINGRRYGSDTARVVHAYKTKRKIINPAYQDQADHVVGKMTIRSLDAEMLAYEVLERSRLGNYVS